MTPLSKIKSAGFELSISENGKLYIEPASKLTDIQRDYLKQHKTEIIAELQAEASMPTVNMTNVQTISVDEAIERTGSPLLIALASLARDENRIREKKITVRCMDCQCWRPDKQDIGLAGECCENRLPPTPPKIINYGCTTRICQHFQSLEGL